MKHKYSVLILCLLLAFVVFASACSDRAEEQTAPTPASVPSESTAEPSPTESTPEPTPESTPEPTQEPVLFTNPLTGETSETDLSEARPYAVMLNDHPDALPQAGIYDADIIYECLVESITRMMAVYAEVPSADRIGPIRSARPYFISLAMAYDAVYIHAGGSTEAYNLLYNYFDTDDIDGTTSDGAYFYRDSSHATAIEHTMFLKTSELLQFITDNDVRTTHNTDGAYDYGLNFTEDAKPDGETANKIVVVFPGTKTTTFNYDEEQNGYTVYQWSRDYIDCDLGEMPVFSNVLILKTSMTVGIDSYGHVAMTLTDTTGSGYYCNGGVWEEITWSRGDIYSNFEYFAPDGSPLELGIGKTYICIQTTSGSGSVTFS